MITARRSSRQAGFLRVKVAADGVEDHIGRRLKGRVYPQMTGKVPEADLLHTIRDWKRPRGAGVKGIAWLVDQGDSHWYHYQVFELTALRPFSTG
jgi:hypothetical protein